MKSGLRHASDNACDKNCYTAHGPYSQLFRHHTDIPLPDNLRSLNSTWDLVNVHTVDMIIR